MNPVIPSIPMRARQKPEYLRRADVLKLAKRNNISKRKVAAIFGPECPARKVLPGATRALYVRVTVLALLGLKDE